VDEPTVITKHVTSPVIVVPLPSKQCNEGWDYQSKGQDWDCDCSEGREQSPINLPPKEDAVISPIKPIFSFNPVKAKKEITNGSGQHETTKTLQIKNKDNALRIKHKYFGKTVTLDGALYTAEEIVFHTPSEHTINGKVFDMEMQVIHYGKSKGDLAKQLVLSFLFKKKPGVYNKFIDDLDFFNLPSQISKKRAILADLFIPKIFYNAKFEDVPSMKPFSFYTYQGSLTAPPCSERTIHYVASEPIPLGSSAIQLFQEAIRIPDQLNQATGEILISDVPPENNRSIQPLNGRAVFYYSAEQFCGIGGEPGKKSFLKSAYKSIEAVDGKNQVKGHYEKFPTHVTEYYYVDGPKPSGMPGAYVVSAKEALAK